MSNRSKIDENDRVLQFNFGKLTHPIYGTTEEILTTINLLESDINHGQDLKIPGLINTSKFEAQAKEYFPKAQAYFEEDLDEEILEKVQIAALKAYFISPSYYTKDLGKNRNFELLTRKLLLKIAIENFMDDLLQDMVMSEESKSNPIFDMDSKFVKMVQSITKYLSSKDSESNEEDFTATLPCVKALLPPTKLFVKDLKAAVSDYKARIGPLKSVSEKAFYRGLSATMNISAGTESSDSIIAGALAGVVVELIAFLNKSEIKPEVRKSEEFKGFTESMYKLCGSISAVFELKKDIELNREKHSAVLKTVADTGISLKEGFSSAVERIQNDLKIFNGAVQALRKSNPGDDHLQNYIQAGFDYVNGVLYWYTYDTAYPVNGVFFVNRKNNTQTNGSH